MGGAKSEDILDCHTCPLPVLQLAGMADLREDGMELQRLDRERNSGLPDDIDYDLEYLVRNR